MKIRIFFVVLSFILLSQKSLAQTFTYGYKSSNKVKEKETSSAAKYNLSLDKESDTSLKLDNSFGGFSQDSVEKKANEDSARHFWRNLDYVGGDFNRIWLENDGRDVFWNNQNDPNSTFNNFLGTTEMRSQTIALSAYGGTFDDIKSTLDDSNQIQTLQSLNLRSGNVGIDDIKELVKRRASFLQLRDLYLGNNDLGPQGIKILVRELLPYLRRLEVLDLEGTNIGSKGMSELINVLPNMTALRAIYLGNNNLGETGISELTKVMPSFSKLRVFSLHSEKMTNNSAQRLISSMSYLVKAQIVDLRSNELDDKKLADLVRIMPTMVELMYLDLASNKIGEVVRTNFLNSARVLPRFKEVIF